MRLPFLYLTLVVCSDRKFDFRRILVFRLKSVPYTTFLLEPDPHPQPEEKERCSHCMFDML